MYWSERYALNERWKTISKDTIPFKENFENYQRILTQQAEFSGKIMSLFLTFNSLGFGGLFVIRSEDSLGNIEKIVWIFLLSILMFLISFLLKRVWEREHALKEAAVNDLKKENVKFPDTPAWTGKTGYTWRFAFRFSLVIWGFILLISGGIVFEVFQKSMVWLLQNSA